MGDEKTTSAAELSSHLRKTKVVTVADTNGWSGNFRIGFVPLNIMDPEGNLLAALRQGTIEDATKRLAESIERPTPGLMRQVLVAGIVDPRIVDGMRNKARQEQTDVHVDDLLKRDVLAFKLYAEIVMMSFGDIFPMRLEGATDAGPGTPP